MSNLVSRTGTVHTVAQNALTRPLCGARVASRHGAFPMPTDQGVTCRNCLRMITRVHTDALELHEAFLLGVAQAEVSAELLGRPERLDSLSDTMLSDEILWARSELALFADTGHLTAYARRLTSLKLEREWRQANTTV